MPGLIRKGTLTLILMIAIGVGGFFLGQASLSKGCVANDYPLINRLIWCSAAKTDTDYIPEYEEFEDRLATWIDGETAQGRIVKASVYFRDFRSGPWFGINGDDTFTPASLFKVPVMIAVLRAAEEIPELLNYQVEMSGAYAGLINVEDVSQTIEPGKLYTVNELLEKMIAYSDNAAADLLMKVLKEVDGTGDSVTKMYRDMGMLAARDQYRLSVKSYSSLFRIVYNARFLGPEMSQKALELLTHSVEKRGIVAGLPSDAVVAHKFGIRDVPGEKIKQYHDCGIVYLATGPRYLLCVMTQSSSVENGIKFISEVSKLVYEEVEKPRDK